MRVLLIALIFLSPLTGYSLNFDARLSRGDLQGAHDHIVELIKTADNDRILAHLNCEKRIVERDQFKDILNFVKGRSILYHALATNGISCETIQFLIDHGADTNFVVKKRLKKKGGKSATKLLTALDVAHAAHQPEEIIALLPEQSDASTNDEDNDFSDSDATYEFSSDDDACGDEGLLSKELTACCERSSQRGFLVDCSEALKDLSLLACAIMLTPFAHAWVMSLEGSD